MLICLRDSKAGGDVRLRTAEAGSGRLVSNEQGEEAKLSDRDRIPITRQLFFPFQSSPSCRNLAFQQTPHHG